MKNNKRISDIGTMIKLNKPVRNDDKIVVSADQKDDNTIEISVAYKCRKFILTGIELVEIAKANGLYLQDEVDDEEDNN